MPKFVGGLNAAWFEPSGDGTTQLSRYIGATISGAPTTGTYQIGDWVVDRTNGWVWVCTTAGSPGAWSNSQGPAGPEGPAGGTRGQYDYKWLTSTAATDPAHGNMKGNNADETLITEMYISGYSGADQWIIDIGRLEVGNMFAVYESNSFDTWNQYEITATPVNNANQWFLIPCVFVTSGPLPLNPNNNTDVHLLLPSGAPVHSVDGRTGDVVLSDLYVDTTGDTMTGNLGLGQTNPTARLQFAADTNPAGGILFGSDTNLYRSAAGSLYTGNNFGSGGTIDATAGFRHGNALMPFWTAGAGSPEGFVSGPIGSLYSRTDGSTNTALYRKEVGIGATGWVATTTTTGGVTSVDGRTGTVVLSDLYVNITGDTMTGQLVAPSVALGTNYATTGVLRFPHNTGMYSRNSSGTADILLIGLGIDAASTVTLGATNAPTQTLGTFGATHISGVTAPLSTTPGIIIRTSHNTVNGWAELGFRGSGTNLVGGLGCKIADHANGYGELWIHSRSAAGMYPRLRIGQTGGADFYGDANAVVSSFSSGGVLRCTTDQPSGAGPDLTNNGTFTGSLSGWSGLTNWAYQTNTAKHTPGSTVALNQIRSFTINADYLVNVVVVGRTAGSFVVRWQTGGTTGPITATSTHVIKAPASGSNVQLQIAPTTDFDGAIDSISLHLITASTPQIYLDYPFGTSQAEVRAFSDNLAIGLGSLASVTSAVSGTAFGWKALGANGTGTANTGIGADAGSTVTYGSSNTYLGAGAGLNTATQYDYTTAVGQGAKVDGAYAMALGRGVVAGAAGVVAIGVDSTGGTATSTTVNDFVLGTANHNVKTSGTFAAAKTIDAGLGFRHGSSAPTWTVGAGTPEGVVSAPVGSIFSRTDGGTDTSFYRKEAGTGATGWVATAAGGGAGAVSSVDGRTGDVVLSDLYVNTTGDTMTGQLTAPNVALGTAPAAWGALKISNNLSITWQNAANSAVAAQIFTQPDNNLWLNPVAGQQGYLAVGGAAVVAWTANSLWFNTGKYLDLNKNEAINLVTHKLAAAPASPVEGQRYYDTALKSERYYDGTKWITPTEVWIGTGAPTGTTAPGDFWYDTDEPATLVFPLTVAQGGTGGTSPTMARSSLSVPYVGNSTTTAGAPTTGTYARGDTWVDSSNVLWVCTVAGSPGTWTQVGITPGAWTAYTPVVSGDTGATTIGNGSVVGRYRMLSDKTVVAAIRFNVGSTTAFNAGLVRLSLPVAASGAIANHTLGAASVQSKAIQYVGTAWTITSTQISVNAPTATTSSGIVALPNTSFQGGDFIITTVAYEAA